MRKKTSWFTEVSDSVGICVLHLLMCYRFARNYLLPVNLFSETVFGHQDMTEFKTNKTLVTTTIIFQLENNTRTLDW